MTGKHLNILTTVLILMTGGVLVLGGTTLAQAESGAPMDAGSFTKVDANKDGVISKQEAQAAGIDDKTFSALDANKDGGISQQEMMEAGAPAKGY
jgi:hypothetical protein